MQIRKGIKAITVILLCFTLPSTADENKEENLIWKQYELEHLSTMDKNKIWRMIAQIYTQANQERIANKSVEEYIKKKGWEKRRLILLTIKGEDCLVVKDIFDYYTCDLPFNFPTFRWSNGEYWVKPQMLGGINEMINEYGETINFMFTSWEDM